MWNKIRTLVQSTTEDTKEDLSTAQAVTALMVYTARIDEDYGADERARIIELLVNHRWDKEASAHKLVSQAELLCDEALDCYGFLRVLNSEFDEEDRLELLRMIWSVVLVDGVLDEYEGNMMRRIANLLGISDVESGLIRDEVLDKA